jgi:hypothetical protein
LREAAAHAGTGTRIVKQFVQAALISFEDAPLPSGRTAISLHSDDVPEIAKLVKSSLTLGAAAKILKIPKVRVKELIDAGVMTPLLAKREINAARWMIPKTQIQQLVVLCGRGASDIETVQVRQILQNWHLKAGEFPEIVKALILGQIPVVGCDEETAFGKKSIDVVKFQEWLQTCRSAGKSAYSVDETAKILGIKQQVAYQLVRAGLIKVDVGPRISINRQEITAFQRDYVALSSLAKRAGKSSRGMLAEIKAQPVSGPSVDGNRQYFFRLSDLLQEPKAELHVNYEIRSRVERKANR